MTAPDATLLAFDTSGAHCAAAAMSGGRILRAAAEEMARGQSERLFPLIETVLAEAGTGWRDLDAIGVGVGPGNFTGIRIAVAAARGLALALDIPAIGVSGFDALAQGYDAPGPVLASLPAPRGRAYVHWSDGSGAPALIHPGESGAVPHRPGATVIGFEAGPIADACGAFWDPAPWDDWTPETAARRIAAVAAARLRAGSDVWERPRPLYVRPADAAPPADRPPVLLP